MILMNVVYAVVITVAVPIVPVYQTEMQLKIIVVSVIMIPQMIVLLIVQVRPRGRRIWMIVVCALVGIQDTIQIRKWTNAEYALVIMKTSRDVAVLMEPLQIIGMIMMVMV
jgi:hypothetical protein